MQPETPSLLKFKDLFKKSELHYIQFSLWVIYNQGMK
jgi:hypothetical protein